MTTPLEIAVDIGRIVRDAQARSRSLDPSESAKEIVARYPDAAVSCGQIVLVLKEEAGAAGLALS